MVAEVQMEEEEEEGDEEEEGENYHLSHHLILSMMLPDYPIHCQ